MITPELKLYIKEAHDSGLSEEDIIINLINAGWDTGDVDRAIGEVLYPEKSGAKLRRTRKISQVSYLTGIVFVMVLFAGSVAFSSRLFVSYLDGYSSANNTASVHIALAEQKKQFEKQNKKSRLLFVGDIMLSSARGTGKQIIEHQDYTYPFLKIAEVLKDADLTFGNLEGPISSRGIDSGGKYSFRADLGVVDGLKFAGFDILSIANNHIFDWGREAFEDTIRNLKLNDIDPVGGGKDYTEANKPIIKNVNGTNIAFLAFSTVNYDANSFNADTDVPGKSLFDKDIVVKTIKQIKGWGIADIIVISFHWGEEYKTRSHGKQQDVAYALIEAGADLIIGHHPHVVQEVERYKNGWIAYSLGNFVFDQSFSEETMRGLILEVEVRDNTIVKVNPMEIEISETFQPSVVAR